MIPEWTESLRDLVTTIRETQLNLQGNRLNTIMKKVTSWAAIIAVPTAITGFYGQNVPYPGFQQVTGFWVSTQILISGRSWPDWSARACVVAPRRPGGRRPCRPRRPA